MMLQVCSVCVPVINPNLSIESEQHYGCTDLILRLDIGPDIGKMAGLGIGKINRPTDSACHAN